MRFPVLNDATSLQDDDAIEVEDCVKLVGDRDDGVVAEFLSNNTLHNFICFGVDAVAESGLVLVLAARGGSIGVWLNRTDHKTRRKLIAPGWNLMQGI